MSAAAELLHCSMAQVLPLQIQLLDNLSQLHYGGKWLTFIIYISQPRFSELACHPRSRVMHQGPVSQATQFQLAQFIKPGPVHKPEFTRAKTLAANSCCTFLMGGPRQMSKENQRERQGKVYEPAFANLNEKPSIPSSKTGCSWRNSWPCPVWGSPGSLSPTHNTATAQHADNISCLLCALCLNHNHFGTSKGGLAEGLV